MKIILRKNQVVNLADFVAISMEDHGTEGDMDHHIVIRYKSGEVVFDYNMRIGSRDADFEEIRQFMKSDSNLLELR